MVGYTTKYGRCLCGDSRKLILGVPDNSVDLILTSPPFPVSRVRYEGQPNQEEYVEWLLEFMELAYSKLKYEGSIIIELGLAYEPNHPIKALYPYEFILMMCRKLGYKLCQDFYSENKTALPTIQYCSKEKIRAKSSVNLNLWFSKTDRPRANITNVLKPYSSRMEKLLEKTDKQFNSKYPSGYSSKSWYNDNGGSIPSNLLQFSNSDGNSTYMKRLRRLGIKPHPTRFNRHMVEFWIKFLTDRGSLVLDMFNGSGVVSQVSEELRRNWLGFELSREYVASSAIRFADTDEKAEYLYKEIMMNDNLVMID